MENSAGFLNSEKFVQPPEEIGGACIYREADACHLHIAHKPRREPTDGMSKENTDLDSEVQRKRN